MFQAGRERRLKLFSLSKGHGNLMATIEKHRRLVDLLRVLLQELGVPAGDAAKLLSPLGSPDDNYSARPYSASLYQDIAFRFEGVAITAVIVFGARRVMVYLYGGTSQRRLTQRIFGIARF